VLAEDEHGQGDNKSRKQDRGQDFQNSSGSRSMSGFAAVARNFLLGWRRSKTNSDNSS